MNRAGRLSGVCVRVCAVVAVAAFAACSRDRDRDGASLDAAPARSLSTAAAHEAICKGDFGCMTRLALTLESLAHDAKRDDVVGPAHVLRVALEASDCRAAMAAEKRLDAPRIDAHDAELARTRADLTTELVSACLFAPPR